MNQNSNIENMFSTFDKLNAVNVNEHIEKKNKLSYLSWAWAWKYVKEKFPDTTYEVREWDGKPYLFDEKLGYMVWVDVTIQGDTRSMWLPVMDGANKAMKSEPYSYFVKKYEYGKWTGEYEEKNVQPATMFDINTSIMRCLVKCLAMHGLGLYIYSGEDLPDSDYDNLNAMAVEYFQLTVKLKELGCDLQDQKTVDFIRKNAKVEKVDVDLEHPDNTYRIMNIFRQMIDKKEKEMKEEK